MPGPFSKRAPVRTRPSERGAALVLFTIMLVMVLLPMVGLAIDGSVAYLAHERLVSATDAAALAAARSLNVGEDLTAQEANATTVAQNYFKANFPPGLLNTSNVSAPTLAFTPPSDQNGHKTLVQVKASADVNLYFMGILGHPSATIQASAQTSRREVNVILTLDRSGSMAGVCGIMKNDAISFVNMFVDGRDALGLVTFMGSAHIDEPWSLSFKSGANNIADALKQLQCANNTGSAEALSLAYSQIQDAKLKRPWASNVIVFFTDGVPNGYMAAPLSQPLPPKAGFPLNSSSTCKNVSAAWRFVPGYIADGGGIYDPTPQSIQSTWSASMNDCPHGGFGTLASAYQFIPETDYYGNSASGYAAVQRDSSNNIIFSSANSDAVSKNAADNAARTIRRGQVTIYVIGLGSNGGVDSTLLKRIANDVSSPIYDSSLPTGRYYYSPNAGQLGSAFNAIASEILRLAQ